MKQAQNVDASTSMNQNVVSITNAFKLTVGQLVKQQERRSEKVERSFKNIRGCEKNSLVRFNGPVPNLKIDGCTTHK